MQEMIHEKVDPYEYFVGAETTAIEECAEVLAGFDVKKVAGIPYAGLGEKAVQEVIVPVIDPKSFMMTKPA